MTTHRAVYVLAISALGLLTGVGRNTGAAEPQVVLSETRTFEILVDNKPSGKSTLAFDILFAEGQRRFLDSMNVYARQFVEQLARPDVDLISGIPPTVSIEQRNSRGGGKSTVATVTEIYHFLRLLFARLGTPYCPSCEIPIGTQTADEICDKILAEPAGTKLYLMAPIEVEVGQRQVSGRGVRDAAGSGTFKGSRELSDCGDISNRLQTACITPAISRAKNGLILSKPWKRPAQADGRSEVVPIGAHNSTRNVPPIHWPGLQACRLCQRSEDVWQSPFLWPDNS